MSSSGLADRGALCRARIARWSAWSGSADGNLVAGLVPTSELPLHLAMYRGRPDVAAIVHTHSMFATVFASLGQSIPAGALPAGPRRRTATGGRRTPATARPSWPRIACKRWVIRRSVLLANHGVVCTGATLAEAMAAAEAIEYVAELAWRAKQSGAPVLLTDGQLAEAAEAFDGYGQSAD